MKNQSKFKNEADDKFKYDSCFVNESLYKDSLLINKDAHYLENTKENISMVHYRSNKPEFFVSNLMHIVILMVPLEAYICFIQSFSNHHFLIDWVDKIFWNFSNWNSGIKTSSKSSPNKFDLIVVI